MLVEAHSEELQFQQFLQEAFQNLPENDPLKKLRVKAWEKFLQIGLPSRNTEAYQYIRLRNLFARNFFAAHSVEHSQSWGLEILPECRGSCLVFVNGIFLSDLSETDQLPPNVTISSLKEAYGTYGTLIQNGWARFLKEEKDPFALLNAALHQEGAFVYIPPKIVFKQPLQIVHLINPNEANLLAMPRLHLFVGAFSEVNVISTVRWGSSQSYFSNQMIDLSMEESSQVRYHQTILSDIPKQDGWYFDAFRSYLKRNSKLMLVKITDGQTTVRHDYYVNLAGEGAEALLNGMWFLTDSKEAHAHVIMEHQQPYCHSMQLFKGVLTGAAKSSFQGEIFVRQAAQKTEAYQLNNNLLLSDGAIADSKPNLRIFADDVKASHGATVGQLDKEQLFYLKTRGFSDVEAKNCLIHGFCQEVIDLLGIESLKRDVEKRVLHLLTAN